MIDSVEYRVLGENDIGQLTNVHAEVFPESRSTRLGRNYLASFYRWLVTPPCFGIGAFDNNTMIGFVVGTPEHYSRAQLRAVGPALARAMVLRPWLLFDNGIRFVLGNRLNRVRREAPVAKVSDGGCVLLSIGVSAKATGAGVGSALMKGFEEAARERGFTHMRLSVLNSNARARRVYEKAGWVGAAAPSDPSSQHYTRAITS